MKLHVKNHQKGFTLIEFIIGLVIAAIMAAFVSTYFGTALTQSSLPISRLQTASKVHQVMENIVADYNRLNKINLRYKWRSGAAYSVGDVVLPSDNINNNSSIINNTGRYYICTQTGTSSATTLPGWTITTPPGTEFTDATVKWKEWGYVWKASTIYPANSIVVPALNNGHYYKGGGTSGTTDPKTISGGWPTTTGGTVSDGTLTWTEVGTILDRSNNVLTDSILLDNIKYYLDTIPGRYGISTVYTVDTTQTKFIKFSGTDQADLIGTEEKNILKVTIKSNDTVETLTELFTIR